MSNLYQSHPKDLKVRKKEDAESISSNEVSDTEDDEPINVKSQNPQSPNRKPKTDKTDKTDKSDNVKEGFTGDSNKKGPSAKEEVKLTTYELFFDFMIAPDTKGMTLTERAGVAAKLFIRRVFMILFLLMFGINIERAANQYANEQYFPTDITKPPYYPTPEEKKYYEDHTKLTDKCETSVKDFRRPSQSYPTYLYYRGMEFPNPKNPCSLQGARTDGWFERSWIQIIASIEFIKSGVNSMINAITALFYRFFKGLEDEEASLVVEPGKEIAEGAEKPLLDYQKGREQIQEQKLQKEANIAKQARKQQANIAEKEMKEEARYKVPVPRSRVPERRNISGSYGNQNTSRANSVFQRNEPIRGQSQTGRGKPYSQKAGDKSAQRYAFFKPPDHSYTKGYLGGPNPYAADKQREYTNPFYPFWPSFAYGARMTAVLINKIYLLFLMIFKSKGEDSQNTPTSQESLIQTFRIFGLLLYSLMGSLGSIALGSLITTITPLLAMIITAIATNTGFLAFFLPQILVLLTYIFLLFFTIFAIIWWRTLYFHIFVFLAPLFSMDETLKELLRSFIKDRTGFFILSWAIFTLSVYQAAPENLQSRILLYFTIIPLISGVAIRRPNIMGTSPNSNQSNAKQ